MNSGNRSASLKGSLLLLLAAVIWGTAFVAQSVGMDYVGGFTFNSTRSLIGALVLLPVSLFASRQEKGRFQTPEEKRAADRTLLRGGLTCGCFLCLASNFQQFGIKYTTVGKAGFITALYIVLVPVIGIFLHRKCSRLIWIAVLMALAGLYLLCMSESFIPDRGDILVMICAVLFAFQILSVDHYSPLVSGVKLSMIQFLVCGTLTSVPALLFERDTFRRIPEAWLPILYAGVLSCGVAYTLQILGQRELNPTVASLIMSLESCISVIAGWLILGQTMSHREVLGCVVMFGAVILAQLPGPKSSSAERQKEI